MHSILVSESPYDISTAILKTGSIFGALSDNAIDFLINHGQLHLVSQHDEIFAYDGKGESFHLVLHGSLDYFKHHDGKLTRTRTIRFGEAIGFVSMIALHNRVGSVYALEEGLLLEVNSQLFSDFHDQYPFDFGILLMNLSRDMARIIRVLSNELVENNVIVKKSEN
ncbi:cyclic nucleotide-binding domain-containing protein [Marinomonas algarum]|uniref:Cyclic nucleotide-binding domain-containing protein n=1 Tax=Marinomonas algarum TaxID=2883105 RepID=A0A9X1IP45_9GAMM|nr:cyclic nucleotide-binding domain-containing protein [Marinomonas algarum]MCB5161886.1 cyclic nucleotide-binding domain-containing protein [Marinomonas algarum]